MSDLFFGIALRLIEFVAPPVVLVPRSASFGRVFPLVLVRLAALALLPASPLGKSPGVVPTDKDHRTVRRGTGILKLIAIAGVRFPVPRREPAIPLIRFKDSMNRLSNTESNSGLM